MLFSSQQSVGDSSRHEELHSLAQMEYYVRAVCTGLCWQQCSTIVCSSSSAQAKCETELLPPMLLLQRGGGRQEANGVEEPGGTEEKKAQAKMK